jgi:hypothetical protein
MAIQFKELVMNYHCLNYLCTRMPGCVCECDYCYKAKGLDKVDPVCPECGYCRHCGRKNEPYNPWINPWIQIGPWYPQYPYYIGNIISPNITLPYIGDIPGYMPTISCSGSAELIQVGGVGVGITNN